MNHKLNLRAEVTRFVAHERDALICQTEEISTRDLWDRHSE